MKSTKEVYTSRVFAEAWDQHAQGERDGLRTALMNDILLQDLGDLSGLSVLDAGCGNGFFLPHLLGLNPRSVTAMDISPHLVEVARQRCSDPRVSFIVADLAGTTGLPTGTFDRIVTYNVLMDLEDLPAAVGELARVLADGGVLHAVIVHPLYQLFAEVDPAVHGLNARELASEYLTTTAINVNILPALKDFTVIRRPLGAYVRRFGEARLATTCIKEIGIPETLAKRIGKPENANLPVFCYFRLQPLDGRTQVPRRDL